MHTALHEYGYSCIQLFMHTAIHISNTNNSYFNTNNSYFKSWNSLKYQSTCIFVHPVYFMHLFHIL
jgi:hypothetical protein